MTANIRGRTWQRGKTDTQCQWASQYVGAMSNISTKTSKSVSVIVWHIYTVNELQLDKEEQRVKFPEQTHEKQAAVTANICWN